MDTPPKLGTETDFSPFEANQELPELDQMDEEVFYNCQSHSTEEIEECGVGTGIPNS